MTQATVRLWGTDIGTVSMRGDYAEFFYDRDFLGSRIQIAPLTLPLAGRGYRFPELPARSFHGLPGLLADSLPDRFGSKVLASYLKRAGRRLESLNPVERLLYVGVRGAGALEFHPPSAEDELDDRVDVPEMVELANQVLSQRQDSAARLEANEEQMLQILRISGSAGGARAKALIAWNPETHEVRSGQVEAPEGSSHWLMKFDGVSGNADKELADPKGFTRVERAYADMVVDCDIQMRPCQLYEEGGRAHFLTERFDREGSTGKIHMLSCAGMAHMDFNAPQQHSYEQVLDVMFDLDMDLPQREQLVRRAIFNVLARNQDDHVKNIAFLMDKQGRWSLAPAYDMTYAYNPAGEWTSRHQMTINGRAEGFTTEDLIALGRHGGIKPVRVQSAIDRTVAVLSSWSDYAARYRVPADLHDGVKAGLRVQHGRALD